MRTTRPSGRLIAVIVCLAALGTLVACRTSSGDATAFPDSSTVAASAPQPGGSLVYAIEADPNGFDPTRNAFDPSGIQLANALYDPIAAFDASGIARPYLAASFEHNPDFTQWTLRLRPNVRFHDGTPLNADAAVTWGRAIQTSVVTGAPAQDVKSIDKGADDLTVVVTMHRPWASFPALLTGQGGYVVAPAQLADPNGHSKPIGTGPFRLDKWERGSSIRVVKNPSYWREGLPYLDSVEFQVIADTQARMSALQAGTVDVIPATDPGSIRAVESLAAEQAVDKEAGRPIAGQEIEVTRDLGPSDSVFLMFNAMEPPFDDVRVRRAVAHATDVTSLAEANGFADRIADGPFAPTSRWHKDTTPTRYDPDEARSLIEAYEREKGPISITLTAAIEVAMSQQLAEAWSDVGIDTKVEIVDVKQEVLLAVGGNYDVALFRYFAAVDPDTNWHFWTSETIRAKNEVSVNMSRLGDPRIDEALRTGRAENDEATREQAYGRLQDLFAELVPYVWLYRSDWVVASAATVHGLANGTLPDGIPAMPFLFGTHRLAETWVESG